MFPSGAVLNDVTSTIKNPYGSTKGIPPIHTWSLDARRVTKVLAVFREVWRTSKDFFAGWQAACRASDMINESIQDGDSPDLVCQCNTAEMMRTEQHDCMRCGRPTACAELVSDTTCPELDICRLCQKRTEKVGEASGASNRALSHLKRHYRREAKKCKVSGEATVKGLQDL